MRMLALHCIKILKRDDDAVNLGRALFKHKLEGPDSANAFMGKDCLA